MVDLYVPDGARDFLTVVWLHGGGLEQGEREIPPALMDQGIAVVGVGYRLRPHVGTPAYIEDAAAAVAWTVANIARYGGDPDRVVVSGHSAGAYLGALVVLDKRWLAAHDLDADRIAGLAPYSGQVVTHFAIRADRGIDGVRPQVDELAPLFHVRADAPPIFLTTGDRELEVLGRYEENAYFMRMLKINGHKNVTLYEFQGYGHGMTTPGFPVLLRWIQQISPDPKPEK